jgi:hypothetical protein
MDFRNIKIFFLFDTKKYKNKKIPTTTTTTAKNE